MTPDGLLRRTARNAGWLLSSKGAGGVLSLVYLALAARSLGVAGFGEFVLVLTYAQAVSNIVQFQSWQTVIRYGAAHLADRCDERLRRLLGFTTLLDVASALAGAALAAAGVLLVGPLLDWTPSEMRRGALFAAAVLLLSLRATPTGVLRLLDRFGLAALAETSLPAMRFVGALAAWWADAGIDGFLLAWVCAEAIASVVLWLAAAAALRAERPGRLMPSTVRGVTRENPGLWRFAWTTNLSTGINFVWQQLGTLAVGAAVGAAAAGGYRLAFQIAQAFSKPTASLARAIYPELAKAALDRAASLPAVVGRTTRLAAVAGAAMVAAVAAGGDLLLVAVGGDAFRFAHIHLVLLTAAVAIELAGFALEPALLATGRAGAALLARVAAAACYVAVLAPLLLLADAAGAAAAAVVGSALSIGFLALALRRRSAPADDD